MIFAIISSILTALSMPGFLWGGIVWFSLIFLFKSMENRKLSFLYAFLYEYLLTFISLYWVIPILTKNLPEFFGKFSSVTGFFVYLLLCLVEAIPFLLFGALYGYFIDRIKGDIPKALFVSSAFTFSEFLRGIGELGFTGIRLSDALYKDIGIIQIASITGTLGIVFLIVLINYILYIKKSKIQVIIITISFIYLANWIVSTNLPLNSANVPIVAVQTNYEQQIKYTSKSEKIMYNIENLIANTPNNYLHILPEAVFATEDIRNSQLEEKLKNISKRKPIILGFPTYDSQPKNSTLVYANGNLVGKYDKIKLFPFVEFLPYEKIFKKFEFLKGVAYFTPGNEFKTFKIDGFPEFGIQICFESYFPEISRNLSNNGAKVLFVITNDGWYKHDTALWQHFSKIVFRAIENQRYVVQVSNTGISGVVDNFGRIQKILPLRNKTTGILNISAKNSRTFYQKFGDWFSILSILLTLLIPLLYKDRRKNRI
ncbi:apolipoprotein N-acyltransferase [Thermosipho africanus Ob7]|uniref:apolipoprotein N-acyltransferase n=1 Tax=Thermosipho africanus TaxID=2421 RepID=UPI000E0A5565|nr:apolipoprotein N-acyltransferase [Thermosipho africanus]RDI92805.1 apolipoprotein N-acyltransferase [Thermosipho africanus Ob7]